MKKNLIKFLVLLCVTTGTCYAQWTTIRTPYGNDVQCNKWGWVHMNVQTAWPNTCTPLEVKSWDDKEYSIPTTEGKCQDNEVALYNFTDGDTEIQFDGCYELSKGEYKKNIHK